MPIRAVLRGQRNAEVALAEVTAVSPEKRLVYTDAGVFPYDILVLATGARHSYFGHPEWERIAPGLKEIRDALEVRQRILTAFEMAELEADPVARQAWLTFVLVGGGPTGVEMAGQIAEMARFTLVRDFRHIHPRSARIVLLEAGPHILPYFPPSLSTAAQHYLLHNGVQVRTKAQVMEVHPDGVVLEEGNERISARTVFMDGGKHSLYGSALGRSRNRPCWQGTGKPRPYRARAPRDFCYWRCGPLRTGWPARSGRGARRHPDGRLRRSRYNGTYNEAIGPTPLPLLR